jgi:hypothetical protein
VGDDPFSRYVFMLFLWGLEATNTACSSSACWRASFTVFSPPNSS